MTRRYLQRSATRTFLLCMLGIPLLIWLYAIAVELNKRMPRKSRLNINSMRIVLSAIGLYFFSIIFQVIDPFEYKWAHYSAMFLNLLAVIFTATVFSRFEESHSIEPASGLLSFFLIWLFPIGIWYLQPKLNKYIEYPPDGT